MALKVVAWDDVNQRLVRTAKDPADIAGGGPTGGTGGPVPDYVQAGSAALTSGLTSISVVYPDGFDNTSYSIQANFTNLVDSSPQFQPVTITTKTASGFTAKWNSPTDSANYRIDYQAVVPYSLYRSNVEDIPISSTSLATLAVFDSAKPFVSGFTNTIDSIVVYQPMLVKNGSQFTPSWNVSLPTADYDLEWNTVDVSATEMKSGINAVGSGVTSITISYLFPQVFGTSYTIIPVWINTVDTNPLYQPITVTSKTLSGFTAKWNSPTDSANYKIAWVLNRES